MPHKSWRQLTITIVVALVFAGFVLPSFVRMADHHAHSANMSAMPMAHTKSAQACDKSCAVCAMASSFGVLPSAAQAGVGCDVARVVFAVEQHPGRGVMAMIDPYPPRSTIQS